jgi:hypothetical protein
MKRKLLIYKLLIIILFTGGKIACGQAINLNSQRLYQYFTSVEAATNGVSVKFKNTGERYLIKIEGQPSRLSEYGETLLIPFGQKVEFHQRHNGLVFMPLEDELKDNGFLLEDRVDDRSVGGGTIKKRGILIKKPKTENLSGQASFKIMEDNLPKAKEFIEGNKE